MACSRASIAHKLKGGSAEFTEHRGYVPGDEIRLIDWKVFGKSDRYFIKQYIEQTCLQVIVVLDGSGSMAFGLKGAIEVPLCARGRGLSDAAGLAPKRFGRAGGAGTSRAQLRAAARQSRIIFRRCCSCCSEAQPTGETSLADNLTELARRIKRRGLIVLLSDCFDDLDSLRQAFQFLRARGHEIILLHIMAPEELTFDFGGWSRFECLEVDGTHLNLDPGAGAARTISRTCGRFSPDLKRICGETGCDYHPLPTDKPMGEALACYLQRRSARLKET